jgi:SOS regulatory protein LexA
MQLETAITKLRKFYTSEKRLPTYEEMCQIFNFSSKNASFYLVKKLIEAGLIEKDQKGRLTPKNLFAIPKLGIIKAGHPMAAETTHDTLDLYQYLLNIPGSVFSLTVKGDSMIDEGITEGDIVIVEKGRTPQDGDVVAACVDTEWTVKYFRKMNGQVVLMPANKNYQPIIPKESLMIGGVVISVIRKYH